MTILLIFKEKHFILAQNEIENAFLWPKGHCKIFGNFGSRSNFEKTLVDPQIGLEWFKVEWVFV